MTALTLTVEGAEAAAFSAVPLINFRLGLSDPTGAAVQSVQLRTQVRIEPDRRSYSPDEQRRLLGLFGDPHRWGETLQAFPWTHVTIPVGGFEGTATVELPVECSYDLEVALGQYLHALSDGVVPLLFLFSGTVFRRGPDGLQIEQIPWDREARYGLPVAVWRGAMDTHFPDSGWLRLPRATLDRLLAYKAREALPTWEATIDELLDAREVGA